MEEGRGGPRTGPKAKAVSRVGWSKRAVPGSDKRAEGAPPAKKSVRFLCAYAA